MGFHNMPDASLTTPLHQLIQQTLGQQVSQPVAQIVAGFSKVFVGEIIERGEPRSISNGQH